MPFEFQLEDFLAPAISAVSAIIAIAALRMQRQVAAQQAAFCFVQPMAEMIRKTPSLLTLHGVTERDLELTESTIEEVAYLYISFAAGEASFQAKKSTAYSEPYDLGEYRKTLLMNPKARRVWELVIRGRLFSRSGFARAVDRFIAENPILTNSQQSR